jgi:DNA repair protein RecO (recombination protein O)
MKQIATQAIMLKRMNYGEADRIVTVLTADNGRLSMLAKGVRKSKSKLAGGLELFSVTDINYIDGKSDLKTIISTRLKEHYRNIVSDVERTMAGYDFMKIIDSFTQHADEPKYFMLLMQGLSSLNNLSVPMAVTNVWFFANVLQINGSDINVEKPLGDSKFTEDGLYSFSYDDMSFFADKSGRFGPTHIKFLRLVDRSLNPEQLIVISGHDKLASDLQQIVKQSAMMHKA